MIFPSLKIKKDLIEKINSLKEIEDLRNEDENKIFQDYFEGKITKKEIINILSGKKKFPDSKKNDIKAIEALIEYTQCFYEFSKSIGFNAPVFKINKRTGIDAFFKNLFKSEKIQPKEIKIKEKKQEETKPVVAVKEKKQEETKPVVAVKEKKQEETKPVVAVEEKKQEETKPVVAVKEKKQEETKPVVTVEEKKQKVKGKSFFEKLFKKKETVINTTTSPGMVTKEDIRPTFEPPKELLPENYQVLIHGFAYSFIKENEHERAYIVAEPELTKEEEDILKQTKDTLINKISLADLNDENQMYSLIEKIFLRNKIKLEKEQKEKIVYYIIRQVSGLDKIEPLMHDPLIEDIECDGIGIPIFIVHRKYGHIVTNISLDSEIELQQFIVKMAHLCKSYVSYASPLLDAILPDGSRVNATLTTNVSTRGPTFTIRKFPQKPLTTIDLVNSETITSEIVAYLWTLIEFKKNIVLIGPTAGGKTTLLNVISSFIPEAQRVVSIEDTREINLLLTNWIPQITRPGFGPPDKTGKRYGEVTMNDLLKESFRQRPDYLIIGEVRGEEMALMFQGMASGHCSLSTLHAKSVEGLITRVTTPPISLDPSLITSLDAIIVTGFSGIGEGKREVKEVDEIKGFNQKENKVEYNAIYKSSDKFEEKTMTSQSDLFQKELPIVYNSDVLKEICSEHNISKTKMSRIISKRTEFIQGLTKTPPKDHIEFNKILRSYKKQENIQAN